MRILLASLLLLPLSLYGAPDADESFLAARDAWRDSSLSKLETLLPKLQGHVLEPYAQYWRLQLRIEEAAPEEVEAFLREHEGSYLAELLRKDWLRVLGKRGQWPLYDRVYAGLRTNEPDLVCYSALSRAQADPADAPPAALSAWETASEIPEGCKPLVDALFNAGKLRTDDVWQRVRLLGAAGRGAALPQTLAYLPERERPTDKQIDRIERDPAAFLKRAHKLDMRKRLNRELTIYATQRLARRDPIQAADDWTALRGRFDGRDDAYVWGQLAFHAALDHLPEALSWYERADAVALADEQVEWQARAALRARDWAALLGAVERLPKALRDESVWVYWRGRALQALGHAEAATAQYERIAGQPHFYGKLALEELGRPLVVPTHRHEPSAEELRAAAANPGFQRAIALFRADMWLAAVREWNWQLEGMDDRQLLAAAEHARRSELWDRAINTAGRTTHLHDYWMRFLAPYRDSFAQQAASRGLDEHWILGLVRQESRFVSHARSSAGATGLMQVMPATARWIARRLGINYRPGQLTDVEMNIALGTGYLEYVLDSLDGSLVMAAAAYNAGPGRARRWKADHPLEGAIYIETIPFGETRNYVKNVMANTSFYAALYGGERQSLKQRLGIIPPRTAGEGYAPTITGQATLQ